MITILAIWMMVLGLIPAALYLVGRIKDPLHPLIFVGVASYFVSAHGLLLTVDASVNYLTEGAYVRYLIVAIISLAGFYLGWMYSRWRDDRRVFVSTPKPLPSAGMLLLFGMFCTPLALVVWITTFSSHAVTGYWLDLGMLWITSSILMIQIIARPEGKKYRVLAIILLVMSVIPPVWRFFDYGQRGDTARLALIASLFYLVLGKRPKKATFIAAACVVGLVLATLAESRAITMQDPSKSRLAALVEVIPNYLNERRYDYGKGEEFLFGAALDDVAALTGEYGFGRAYTVRLISRFAPKEYFPDKWEWFNSSVEHEFEIVDAHLGYRIAGGAAISGAAQGFFELGWFCPVVWFILGYFHQKIWYRATVLNRLQSMGYLIGYNAAMVYAILQDVYVAEVNMIFVLLPLFVLYLFPERKTVEREAQMPAFIAEPAI